MKPSNAKRPAQYGQVAQDRDFGRKYLDPYDLAAQKRSFWQAVLAFLGLRAHKS